MDGVNGPTLSGTFRLGSRLRAERNRRPQRVSNVFAAAGKRDDGFHFVKLDVLTHRLRDPDRHRLWKRCEKLLQNAVRPQVQRQGHQVSFARR